MNGDGTYNEKKLLGSGGYAFAKLTDEEQNKSNLGVSETFLDHVGRLNEDIFLRSICNNTLAQYRKFNK